MADLDSVRFPPLISMNAVGGPRFKTSLAVMASGAESRTQEWEIERGEWTVSHVGLPADWQPLFAFVRVVAGMANTFRFKDWTDYICASGEGFFVSNISGSPTQLQMVKRYTFGAYTYDRFISKPRNGTITTDASGLNYATGIVNSGTFWRGEFDCWGRLNNDLTRAQVLDRNIDQGLIIRCDFEIVEVRDEAV